MYNNIYDTCALLLTNIHLDLLQIPVNKSMLYQLCEMIGPVDIFHCIQFDNTQTNALISKISYDIIVSFQEPKLLILLKSFFDLFTNPIFFNEIQGILI